MNTIDLKDRKAVVTGGAGGIGGAIVARLAASGASVAVWDLHGSTMDEVDLFVETDVTSSESVATAADTTLAAFGSIDILVTAAGATGPTKPVRDIAEADWRRIVDLNLTGTFLSCQAVLPGMLANDFGRIITISSIAGKQGNRNLAAYSAAKAGVIGLTKVLALELAETGIRCNAVTPGLFRTAILDQMSEEAVRWSLDRIPMRRPGKLQEIGALVAWMASEECSFSTGAVFDISGGRAS